MNAPTDEGGPPETDFSSDLSTRLADAPTDERVYRVALELVEPTRVSAIAERADCSKNAARRHLDRLVEIGVLTRVIPDPAAYRRNESYFEWRRLDRLANLPKEEFAGRLDDLLSEEAAYREEYDGVDPGEIDPLEYDDPENIWQDLNNWEAIRAEIRDLRRAREYRSAEEGIA
ncbi:DUF7342 family protein [Halovivax gelatinilyticus]|uniref:DUF7342 family protein n=1 Tax=Halovivax gelatinilyticus TaxID=2961597 RepID=UPI0020CA8352|nr:helix-turn-helix domain-containing protein [Halovivax gelatinilyticus]